MTPSANIDLAPEFADAGWDKIDILDALMVLDDILDDMDEQGYIDSRARPGTPPSFPGRAPAKPRPSPPAPRKRRTPNVVTRVINRIRKWFRR